MRILFTNTGPWGTGSATVVDAVSLEMMRQRHHAPGPQYLGQIHLSCLCRGKPALRNKWLIRSSSVLS